MIGRGWRSLLVSMPLLRSTVGVEILRATGNSLHLTGCYVLGSLVLIALSRFLV